MQTPEHLHTLYATYVSEGHDSTDHQALLIWLRAQGCSVIDSVKMLMLYHDRSLRQAKEVVHYSIAWSDRRAEHEAFHDQLIQVAEAMSSQIDPSLRDPAAPHEP